MVLRLADLAGGRVRSETVRALIALVLVLSAGCEPPPVPPPSDPELRAELGIPDQVRIHLVVLSGSGDQSRIVPRVVDVLQGEVVQLVVVDRRTHLIRFDERMEPHLRDFLLKSGQLSFPPLLELGARIVLSFEGAPAGIYPFLDEGSGPPATGEIRVSAP